MASIKAIVLKTDDDYTVWYPEIPDDEPLLIELLEKYTNDGCSTRGTREQVVEDLGENLV